MPFGQFINLLPQVSVLLPDFVQLCLSLGAGAAGLETQPGDDGLLCTFGRHGSFVGGRGSNLDFYGETRHFKD